jgi:CheY-like chemotaxis protein
MNEKFHVLVADDNRAMTEALRDVLEVKGYDVTVAYDGVEAVDKGREADFDCVLMDIRMPRMGGVEAFKQIKKLSSDTKVILMTAYSVQTLIDEARSEGVLAVLQKPVDMGKIFQIIDGLKDGAGVILVASGEEPHLGRHLTEHGYRVAVSRSASEAVELSCAGGHHAVVLEADILGLTAPDNVVLCRNLDPKCLIILLSAVSGEAAAGASASLQKPFKIKEVIAVLEGLRVEKLRTTLGDELFEL